VRGPRALAAAGALLLAGCAGATWRTPRPGERIGPDEIVVVGSFAAVPPFQQVGPAPTSAVLVGELRGNLVAFFAPDLAERWDPGPTSLPLARAERALLPLRGHFFFVVPRPGAVYLRGVVLQTDAGADKYELPIRIDLAAGDRVVYVGELKLVRTGDARLLVRDERAAARKAAGEAGLTEVVALPWRTRLARP
jgi:hypothetical protein